MKTFMSDKPVYRRADGSFLITLSMPGSGGLPYHVIESDPLWDEVSAWAAAHPDQVQPDPAELPPPPPTLEEAKAAKRAELMAMRDGLIAAGFRHGEHTFPLNPDIQIVLTQEYIASQAMPAPSYEWKDIGGVYRDIGDVAAFQGFCIAAMGYGKALYAREQMLHKLIGAATTVEAVVAITWNTVPSHG